MFRAVLPRFAGRSVYRASPQIPVSNVSPLTGICVFGRSKRGYATASGKSPNDNIPFSH